MKSPPPSAASRLALRSVALFTAVINLLMLALSLYMVRSTTGTRLRQPHDPADADPSLKRRTKTKVTQTLDKARDAWSINT